MRFALQHVRAFVGVEAPTVLMRVCGCRLWCVRVCVRMRDRVCVCLCVSSLTDVKVIQVDISSEEIGNNVPATVGLVGDVRAISSQLADAVTAARWKFPQDSAWWTELRAKVLR